MKKIIVNKNNQKSIGPTKVFFIVVLVFLVLQAITVAVFVVLLVKDSTALNNYRELQNKQIAKVTEDCNNKIATGVSVNEDLTRRAIRTLGGVIGENSDKLENIYLRDLSMSYCRASEFVLQGIPNVNGRSFIRGDYLFGTGETPRKITSETFRDIQW